MLKGESCWWDISENYSDGCLPMRDGQCDNCYAAQLIGYLLRHEDPERYEGIVERTADGRWRFTGKTQVRPRKHPVWNFALDYPGADRPVLGPGKPSLIFVNDMSDLFFRQPVSVMDRIIDTHAASRHITLILSRRVGRMSRYFLTPPSQAALELWRKRFWLGTSTAHQNEFDAAWPHMRAVAERGYLIFFSIAPMLGPVVLPPDLLALGGCAWVICSGEQGPHEFCRPMEEDWARRVRDQCLTAGIPFFGKQLDRKRPIPFDLMIREFPHVD